MGLSAVSTAKFGESFPVGTVAVNLIGCLLIGAYAGTVAGGIIPSEHAGPAGDRHRPARRFTTFSSFAMQTVELISRGDWLRAALNIFVSLVFGLLAVWVGGQCGAALSQR
jgi:CrcB protein